MNRRKILMTARLMAVGMVASLMIGCASEPAKTDSAPPAAAAPVEFKGDPIKVGVLHSLSGTMAISETTLKDTILMMIEEQNKAGGLLGRQLQPGGVAP